MRAPRVSVRPGVVAVHALFLALGVCAASLTLAWRTDPLAASAGADSLRIAAAAAAEVPPAGGPIAATVAAGPFRPDRTPPATRYRIASASAPTVPAPSAPRSFVPPMRLQGIAMLPRGGGMAALSVQGRPPQIVRQGQMFEGFRLLRVRADAATLVGPDTTIVLQLSGAPRQP